MTTPQQTTTPLTRIPDDNTIDAALYGTAHIETVLAREAGEKLLRVYRDRVAGCLDRLDCGLAGTILETQPELVYSDDEIIPGYWPEDVEKTVLVLRDMIGCTLAAELIEQWIADADHRGRLIGLGEHSARACVSGSSDRHYKAAISRRSVS